MTSLSTCKRLSFRPMVRRSKGPVAMGVHLCDDGIFLLQRTWMLAWRLDLVRDSKRQQSPSLLLDKSSPLLILVGHFKLLRRVVLNIVVGFISGGHNAIRTMSTMPFGRSRMGWKPCGHGRLCLWYRFRSAMCLGQRRFDMFRWRPQSARGLLGCSHARRSNVQ